MLMLDPAPLTDTITEATIITCRNAADVLTLRRSCLLSRCFSRVVNRGRAWLRADKSALIQGAGQALSCVGMQVQRVPSKKDGQDCASGRPESFAESVAKA